MKLIYIARWTPVAILTIGPYGLLASHFRWPAWPAMAITIVCGAGALYLMSYRCGACRQVVYTKENLKGFSRMRLIFKGPPLERCLRCGADLP